MRRSFVGRDEPLAALQDALDRAVSGRGGLVRVLGEPGVGKTRLADELVERAYADGLTVGWARSWRGSPPFGLVVDLVRSALGNRDAPNHPGDTHRSALAPLLPELGQEPGPATVTRHATIDALCALVRSLGPSLLVIDDLHGADLDSLTFLLRLVPLLKHAPTLVLATERSVATAASPEVERHLTDLARISDRVDLEGLDVTAVGALMAEVTGHPVDARIAEGVHRATQGNALFVDGVLRAAIRDGSFEAGTLRFPRDVRQAILVRAEAAGRQVIDILGPASLLTRPLSVSLLCQALELESGDVLAALERAVEENLLVAREGGRFGFRHALVADALAATLSPADRAHLHNRLADAILLLEGEAASSSEIAYHRCEAVPAAGHELALAACSRAARQAADVRAHEEAARLLQRMKELLELHAPANRVRRLEVLLDRGQQLLLAGRRGDARVELFAAAGLADSLGDVAALAAAALAAAETGEFGAMDTPKLELLEKAWSRVGPQATALRVRLGARLAAELWVDGASKARREELSRTALSTARTLGGESLLRVALDARFQSLWGPSSLDERVAIADELMTMATRSGDVEESLSAHGRRLLVAVET